MSAAILAMLVASTQTSTLATDFFAADVRVGFAVPVREGDLSRVAEFVRLDPRPRALGWIHGLQGGVGFAFDTRFAHERDFDGALTLDLFRWARVDLAYDRLPRRYARDSLANLGFDGVGRLDVSQTNVDRALDVDRAEVRPRLTVKLPRFAFVDQGRVVARYRYLARDGHEQVQTFAHCPTCHIHGTTRQLRQRTHELDVGVDARLFERVAISYRHLTRSLDETAPPPTFDYPRPPDLGQAFIPISGEQPFAQVPDATKNVDRIALSWAGPHGIRATGVFVHSRTENDVTNLRTTATFAAAKASARVLTRGRAALGYRIAIVQREADGAVDYTAHRITADGRAPFSGDVAIEAGYHLDLLGRAGRLRNRTPDPNAEGLVFVDERFDERMTRHTAYAAASARIARTLRGRLKYQLVLSSDPLSVIGRQTSFAPVSGDRPAPVEDGVYPTLSTEPTTVHEARVSVRWAPHEGVLVTPSYTLQLADGVHESRRTTGHRAGMVATYTPAWWFHVHGAYHFRQDHVRTDLFFGQVGGLRADDAGWVDVGREALYESRAHTGIVSVVWAPLRDLRTTAAGVYSAGEAAFSGGEPSASVGALSALAVQTKSAIAGVEWAFMPMFRAGVQYRFDEFTSRPGGAYDGRRQSVWVSLGWVEEDR